MWFLILLRLLLALGIMVGFVTQVALPLWYDRPLFPIFRAMRTAKLEAQVKAVEQLNYDQYLADRATKGAARWTDTSTNKDTK